MDFEYILILLPSILFLLALYRWNKGDNKSVTASFAIALFLLIQNIFIWEMRIPTQLSKIESELFRIESEIIKIGGKIKQ